MGKEPTMVIIRKEQMEVLSKNMVDQFIDRAGAHLQRTFPEQIKNMAETDLREMIHAGIVKAESYDITDEVDVERFLECMVRFGFDFDNHPQTSWAGQILQDKSLSGTEKMNQIDDYALFVLTTGKI